MIQYYHIIDIEILRWCEISRFKMKVSVCSKKKNKKTIFDVNRIFFFFIINGATDEREIRDRDSRETRHSLLHESTIPCMYGRALIKLTKRCVLNTAHAGVRKRAHIEARSTYTTSLRIRVSHSVVCVFKWMKWVGDIYRVIDNIEHWAEMVIKTAQEHSRIKSFIVDHNFQLLSEFRNIFRYFLFFLIPFYENRNFENCFRLF